ncbi:TRADD-N-associated membrane domain-containing protein [Actinomadura citrea]|uniref:TRADD-N-associated membrane domain-containing protein n=1 Tax=Actinomadura citrea TaxID=46158 RepID=UPI003CE49FDC
MSVATVYWTSRRDRAGAERAQRNLQRAEDQLVAGDQLALPALWEVTQKRLDYYHQIATSQARTSFRNAQAAMVIGFVLLAVFAALAATAETTAAAAVTGALGAVAAALAGYVSRTFVRSQESSAGHLRSYFDQPLEFSRYLAAERLLASVQHLDAEQRAAILADLLRTVITPAGAAPPGGAAAAPSAVTINLPTSPPAAPPAASGDGGPR